MEPTLKKILSRFDGDVNQSMKYCIEIAGEYPHLAEEYSMYYLAFKKQTVGKHGIY